MTRDELKKMRELDDAAEKAGGYVAAMTQPDVRYNYRKIGEYCREQKKDPQDLTLRELRKFMTP